MAGLKSKVISPLACSAFIPFGQVFMKKIQVSLLLTSISNEFLLSLLHRTVAANLTGVKVQGMLVKARVKQSR